ncbi:hypothetical protein U1Q18_005387 [Sarracenia purpurea var. burkii]
MLELSSATMCQVTIVLGFELFELGTLTTWVASYSNTWANRDCRVPHQLWPLEACFDGNVRSFSWLLSEVPIQVDKLGIQLVHVERAYSTGASFSSATSVSQAVVMHLPSSSAKFTILIGEAITMPPRRLANLIFEDQEKANTRRSHEQLEKRPHAREQILTTTRATIELVVV